MTTDIPHDAEPVLGDRPAPEKTGFERSFEEVAREFLKDRRSERRWKIFFRLMGLVLLGLVAIGLLAPMGGRSTKVAGPHTALVDVHGEIDFGGEAGADALVSALKDAFEAPNAKAVILRVNSPGGSPVQAGIVNDEIKRLKAKHGKKVYAVVEEMCASGAYYIAVAADEIVVDKASLVGSIGVLMDGFGFVGTMEKLGVERRLLTAGENKGMLDPFSPQNEKHTAYAKAMIDQIHQQFIKVVKDGRGPRLKDDPEMFSGLFWNGEEAVRLGLADRLGNVDSVARDTVHAETVVDYTQHDNLAERLARRFGASLGASLASAMRAPLIR